MSFRTSFWLLPQKSHRTPTTSVPLGIDLSIVGLRASLALNPEEGARSKEVRQPLAGA